MWVDVELGVDERCSVDNLMIQGCVDVVKQGVADVDDFLCCRRDACSLVEFLRDSWCADIRGWRRIAKSSIWIAAREIARKVGRLVHINPPSLDTDSIFGGGRKWMIRCSSDSECPC